MSLTVQCDTCKNPDFPRRVVQWRQGSCRDCADDCASRHLAEFPDHTVQIFGHISDSPFGAGESIRRLFGRRTA